MITKRGDDYLVPAYFVHWLIITIFASLLSIAGYMVVWAKGDVEWKAVLMSKVSQLERDLEVVKSRVEAGELPLAKQRLNDHERRLQKLEERR